MNNLFLKKDEIKLVNGGYLSNSEGNSVYNEAFVEAQDEAHYVVMLAKAIKGKDFKGKRADDINSIKETLHKELYAEKIHEFVEIPKEPKLKIRDQMAKEAIDFMDFTDKKSKIDEVNSYMNKKFKVLIKFEKHGLFFEKDVCELNAIYSLKEIIAAVEETIDFL